MFFVVSVTRGRFGFSFPSLPGAPGALGDNRITVGNVAKQRKDIVCNIKSVCSCCFPIKKLACYINKSYFYIKITLLRTLT